MTFGGYTYGSAALGSSPSIICTGTPSCNLIVMEILQRLRDTGICTEYPNPDIYDDK